LVLFAYNCADGVTLERVYVCMCVGSLQIRQSVESDEGKYECVAENAVGVMYAQGAYLYVRGK
jgi:hypothetical protein